MAIEKIVTPYEILVRFDADGIKAAHVKDLEELKDTETGEVYSDSAKECPARPLDLAGEEYQSIVSSINTAIQAENETLKIEKAALQALVTELQKQQ